MRQIRDIRIEISGVCNAKCPYCPGSKSDGRAYKFMEVQLFDDIIRHLFAHGILKGGESIGLFCRGEPTIHPRFSEILKILKSFNLKACVSSNFISYKELDDSDFDVIGDMTFSTCGISKATYKKVYGADVNKTLSNFRKFLEQRQKVKPSLSTRINWIRYRFNADEESLARNMFADFNIEFNPIVGSLINFSEVIDIYENNDHVRVENIDKDLFLKEQLEAVDSAASYGNFLRYCEVGNDLIIDELGRWIRCSYISPWSDDFAYGVYTDINLANVTSQKLACETCEKCIGYAIANSVYSPDSIKHLGNIKNIIEKLDKESNVIVYGFGFVGFSIYAKLHSMGFSKINVIDDGKSGSDILGIDIRRLGEFKFDGNETVIVSAVNKNTAKKLADNMSAVCPAAKVVLLV